MVRKIRKPFLFNIHTLFDYALLKAYCHSIQHHQSFLPFLICMYRKKDGLCIYCKKQYTPPFPLWLELIYILYFLEKKTISKQITSTLEIIYSFSRNSSHIPSTKCCAAQRFCINCTKALHCSSRKGSLSFKVSFPSTTCSSALGIVSRGTFITLILRKLSRVTS